MSRPAVAAHPVGPVTTPRLWRAVAAVEVVATAVAIVADWLIPSLVLATMAVLSLAVRRTGPHSLGLRRPGFGVRLAGQMLAAAVALTVLDLALLIPIANHVSGRRQDVSDFADLQGDLGLLVAYLLLGWTLAAFVEELAFRGYLFTRLTDVLGTATPGVVAALLLSSALFALLHTEQGLVGAVVAGVDAAVYGVLRIARGTLWAPILAHGFVDTIGFVTYFLVGPVDGLW